MNEVSIRKAILNDVDTLLVFEQGVIAAERPFDSTLQHGLIHYYDIEKMITASDVELVVACMDDKLIGSGYARVENVKPYLKHRQHAYLGFMYVDPQYRGKGVNKMIIDALEKWAASEGITELRLDVYFPNAAAIKAYEKSGFTCHMLEMRKAVNHADV